MTMLIVVNRLNKIVKCSNNDDSVTLRASDSSDHVTLLFESPSELMTIITSLVTFITSFATIITSLVTITSPITTIITDQDRVSEYEMKLMDIDSEHVGIPVSQLAIYLIG